jgi:HlyD family secretion protein
MNRKKLIIGLVVVVAFAAIAYANLGLQRSTAPEVTTEEIRERDLEAIVSASGAIEPKSTVDISAETMGKVVNLAVVEGERVSAGQFLLQIDPRNLETQVRNREASLASARSRLEQTKAQIENNRLALQQAQDNLRRQEELWNAELIPREQYERAINDEKMRQTDLAVTQQSMLTQGEQIHQEEANLESAQHDLTRVRVVSPIDGIVTRQNIEVGETAVVGTMNNAGSVLLTIADLSVINAEIEVDETDIPYVQLGQPAEITIDALPDLTFPGTVTEVGNSPIQTGGGSQSTNFKVVITIDGEVPGVRPGFTCTAVITTATREQVVAVPIQAVTIREMIVDADGNIVRDDPDERRPTARTARRTITEDDLEPGQTLEELEGVFVARDGRAVFVPIDIGIAGESYFEVLEGLALEDRVITGPFASVREIRDGDEVDASDESDEESDR